MNPLLLTVAVAFALSEPGTFASQQGDGNLQLRVDGVERSALVFTPDDANSKPCPVVFGWHGHGGGSRQAARSFRIHELWPEAIVVYPKGLPTNGKTDPEGKKPGWQQGLTDNSARDLKFFDALLTKIKSKWNVDSKRLYTMGHSNGGRFTYVLWAARGDAFAAYGPSGSPVIGLSREFRPASVFHVAGKNDHIVPYVSQQLSIESLKTLLSIPKSDTGTTHGYITNWTGKNGHELKTYIHPGGHQYPVAVPKLLVEFFKAHSKRL